MTREETRRFDRLRILVPYVIDILSRGARDFGIFALTEVVVRKQCLGGRPGWYLIPVSVASGLAALIQGVSSLTRCKDVAFIEWLRGVLTRTERFLTVNAMLELTLSSGLPVVVSLDKGVVFLLAEAVAAPFAFWRAKSCGGRESPILFKLITLPQEIKRGLSPVDVEMAMVSSGMSCASVFSLDDYKSYLANKDVDIQGSNNAHLKGYLFGSLWLGDKTFLGAMWESLACAGDAGSIAGFVMLCLLGVFSLKSLIFSSLFTLAVSVMAGALGFQVVEINNMLLELRFSDLQTNSRLWKEICELSCKFYDSRKTIVGVFAKVTAFVSTTLLLFIGLMFMGNAPSSINSDKSRSSPLWYAGFSLCLSMCLAWRIVGVVRDEEKERFGHDGTRALLEEQGGGVGLVVEEIENDASIVTPVKVVLVGSAQHVATFDVSPNSSDSGDSARSDDSVQSSPERTGGAIDVEAPVVASPTERSRSAPASPSPAGTGASSAEGEGKSHKQQEHRQRKGQKHWQRREKKKASRTLVLGDSLLSQCSPGLPPKVTAVPDSALLSTGSGDAQQASFSEAYSAHGLFGPRNPAREQSPSLCTRFHNWIASFCFWSSKVLTVKPAVPPSQDLTTSLLLHEEQTAATQGASV